MIDILVGSRSAPISKKESPESNIGVGRFLTCLRLLFLAYSYLLELNSEVEKLCPHLKQGATADKSVMKAT